MLAASSANTQLIFSSLSKSTLPPLTSYANSSFSASAVRIVWDANF